MEGCAGSAFACYVVAGVVWEVIVDEGGIVVLHPSYTCEPLFFGLGGIDGSSVLDGLAKFFPPCECLVKIRS